MTPRAYQISGSVFLAMRQRALLADPPGLGKTAQAILAAKAVDAKTVCIICPAIAISNWRREWLDWWADGPAPLAVSYDKVVRDKKLRDCIAKGVDVLILDEAHYLKTRDSQRTKFIYNPLHPEKGLTGKATYCWALSGTFAPNNVTEYWSHLRALFPEYLRQGDGTAMCWTEFLQFFTHWTPSNYGPKIIGSRNKEALSRILREVGLRRSIADVLPELPPLVWGQVTVDGDAVRAEIDALEEDDAVAELKAHIEDKDDFHAFAVHLSTLRRLIGIAKAPVLVQLVCQELYERAYDKIVIWAQHVDVINAIANSLHHYGAVAITGATSLATRTAHINAFQTDPYVRVLVGQLQAAGTAVTLTAANQVLFAESSWVPAEMEQAAKRCHRYGQQRPVFARVSALSDSIDELIAATLTLKLSTHVEVGELEHADNH